jgi:hypothetical protein
MQMNASGNVVDDYVQKLPAETLSLLQQLLLSATGLIKRHWRKRIRTKRKYRVN